MWSPQVQGRRGCPCPPPANQTEERGEPSFRVHRAKLTEILTCLVFVFLGGDSSIYQEKISIFIPCEGDIWKMINYQRYFQTESLGPVPRSFHCFSGQNYSRLQHELGGGEAAAVCQLLHGTLMPTCTTSDWTPAPASLSHLRPALSEHSPEKQGMDLRLPACLRRFCYPALRVLQRPSHPGGWLSPRVVLQSLPLQHLPVVLGFHFGSNLSNQCVRSPSGVPVLSRPPSLLPPSSDW
uniref:Uncharacterized protein n=1 Tax=Molossus molossus TaxID=27622 RepID=A0A7J8I1W3_MOLMO|nr:hypothetical protein HJG59_010835 [Molossus molossus]